MHSSLRAFLLVSVTLVALATYADAKSVRADCADPLCTVCQVPAVCTECDGGSTLTGSSCAPNTCDASVQNCERCTTINGTTCHTCSPGYTLNSGSCAPNTCKPSVLNCERCTTEGGDKCQTCSPGYHENTNTKSCESNTCAVSVEKCERCTVDNGNECQTCISGYQLKNSLCVKSSDAASRAPGSALAAVAVLVTGAAAYAM